MPQLGETVSEGTIIDWLANVGSEITARDALLEVSTDKVDAELPSPVSGVLTEILAAPGDTVAVGSVIARIAVDGDAVPSTSDVAPTPAPEPTPEPTVAAPPAPPAPAVLTGTTVSTPTGDRLRVSPVARRIAAERNIDVKTLVGTGPAGAILKRDVPTHVVPVAAATQRSTLLTAHLQVNWAEINATKTNYPTPAFVIRALVDSLRSEAATSPSLGAFVEPAVQYVHAGNGQGVALPNAAGLRISALSTRLKSLSNSPFEATVTIVDSSEQSCALSGILSSAISVGIGPRRTIPTATTSGTGMAIVFADMVDVTVTVDATQISVQALTALTNQLKLVLETRDWSTEV